MDPIVLVGNGEYHYRLIENLKIDNQATRPIILVSEDSKCFANTLGPAHVAGLVSQEAIFLDTWSLCQRKGVYFLRDQCLDMSFEDRTLFLKKYGKLKFHKASFEFAAEPKVFSSQLCDNPSILRYREGAQFCGELKKFFKEVHLHCPRETRVVLSGLSREVVEYATVIQNELQKSCPRLEIQILYAPESWEGWGRSLKKLKKRLSFHNIYLREALVEKVEAHCLTLSDGAQLEFDVFIPMQSWRIQDVVGRHLQRDEQSLIVSANLALREPDPVFAVGTHVGLSFKTRVDIDRYDLGQVVQVLGTQLLTESESQARLEEVSALNRIWQSPVLGANWLGHPLEEKEIKALWREQILDSKGKANFDLGADRVQKSFQESLSYEAAHMSRPWSGLTKEGGSESDYQLHSVNGFNWWGSFAESATRICEMTLLKSLTKGAYTTHMRFSLSLPRATPALHQHIFESTLKAIERVCEKYDVELDGGHTFDGDHWQLHITTGGVKTFPVVTRFRLHDYLILTRPLGYGPLWTSRLSPDFNSEWVEQEVKAPILNAPFALQNFVANFDVSALVMVEEWGFLYHAIQYLPGKAQMMVNFREVPRWSGVDRVIGQAPLHPSSEHNWQRVMGSLPFQQDEVSVNNRVLWDPLSQGALVMGVSADSYSEALCNLHQMGYTHANLIGCVRPQVKGYKVVLSDWKPR